MLEALTHPVLTPVVRTYLHNSVRGHFSKVMVRLESPIEAKPTIFFATHQSWWDGHLILALTQYFKLEFRVMMLEQNLRKYNFLRYAGAFGVNRSSIASVRSALRYSVSALESGVPTALLLFPSGEIGSPFVRPIPFESGLASLVLQCSKASVDVQVLPLAMRLEYDRDARPSALLRVGAAQPILAGSISSLTKQLQQDLTLQADALQQDALNQSFGSYQAILQGALSAQEAWDLLRLKLGFRL